MGIAVCHPDDLRYCPISSGWYNVIWNLSHPVELAPGRISSGWLLDAAVCHPDDISKHHMSSGWLSRNWYLIRMSYDNVIMSSGWHTLPFLSHPDEIANFDFPQHAVALQRFRTSQRASNTESLSTSWCHDYPLHYTDVIMTTIASQITSIAVVYSTVYSDADQRKHQSSASLAFVWVIHRDRWIPRTKDQ